MDDIQELEIRLESVNDSMNECKLLNDMLGHEFYRGLQVGLMEKLELLKSIKGA